MRSPGLGSAQVQVGDCPSFRLTKMGLSPSEVPISLLSCTSPLHRSIISRQKQEIVVCITHTPQLNLSFGQCGD
jgi:hypothetical protein